MAHQDDWVDQLTANSDSNHYPLYINPLLIINSPNMVDTLSSIGICQCDIKCLSTGDLLIFVNTQIALLDIYDLDTIQRKAHNLLTQCKKYLEKNMES